jgi:multidrug efflux pump
MGLSRFFIDRPVFAWVIAVIIMLAGGIAALNLPIEQYPTIAPPSVVISATYPGADANSLQNSVTQVIEQQLTGLDNLLYFSSQSNSNGTVQITATFAAGTNPDIAQVQVQNKVQAAVPLLPSTVQQLGVLVAKNTPNFIIVIGVYDDTGRWSNIDISDFIASKMQDPLSRVPGVGNTQVFGSQYAMRIWLDPFKLQNYSLQPSDVFNAVQAQNVQVSAGQIGAQPSPAPSINATVTAQSQLQTPEQFRNIILKTSTSGAVVRLGDVARVELGAETYSIASLYDGYPAAGIPIMLAPGANALKTVDAVKAKAKELEAQLPPGMKMIYPVDNTTFIRLSIHDVVVTLLEAIALVVLVMYIFLQNWRATLIPAIAVPVVLLGTFGVLAAAHYSINTLTLFALVLVIGLLVDDAIVVVENVERIMHEERLSPRDATLKSMGEITGALIGIGLVLTAVFLPMAFFGGSTGAIYRQFSITIVSAMTLSIMVALILSPSLCATLLKPVEGEAGHQKQGFFFDWFNRNFDHFRNWYQRYTSWFLHRTWFTMLAYLGIVAVLAFLFVRLPTGFLPDEDQGFIFNLINLPAGTPQPKTLKVAQNVAEYYLDKEKNNVDFVFAVAGFSFAGSGENTGIAFTHLKDWSVRKGAKNASVAIANRAMMHFFPYRDAQVFAIIPPSVQELGNATGFDLELEDHGNSGHDALIGARNQLLGLANRDPLLLGVRPNSLDDTPQLHVAIDQDKASTLGVSLADINSTLTAAWGSTFINDFIDRGRVKRVYMQGDAPYRMTPQDLDRWYVRSSNGTMAPFSSFATSTWAIGPASLTRYNGLPAIELQGQGQPGVSTGTATQEMYKLAAKLPKGFGIEPTGLSYQEEASGAQAPALYGLSILVIYLCLAALYESWAIPLSVMMVIPLGVIGALALTTLRGLFNDIYFQVGLLTTIGLSAKNAILIVEFAVEAESRGASAFDAAMEAARLRLRPILMTSIAFIAGVTPLALAHGAGAGSQNAIGTGVVGGMITATVLAIFFVPVFFQLINTRLQHHK